MNDAAELTILVAYLRSRVTLARRDEAGLGAVEWAIIVAVAAAIALAVGRIIQQKAIGKAKSTPTD